MSGVKSTLKDLSSNAVREIAPDLIEEDGPKDRLAFADADVAQLAESIRQHGQQVPIMVRPMAEKPGSYRIVYGRRRLRALRLLGQPAKALVRALSDDEAILAQGQENAQRLDPSFIEKSLFAAELAASGYETAVILDALGRQADAVADAEGGREHSRSRRARDRSRTWYRAASLGRSRRSGQQS
ncbi:ParB/RepB/Spo0J family partition protein [Rhodobacter xanthinilyticus]|uniref:ParB/RepB/Spo0J family partition protein n=1 Tax=Rhodobacter xanthinilyticus TaxID=1850250 RepID=UPI000B3059DF|nr:ParB/RepB/Spo0J family partition protein [Rhodobacter xanthinilyticus]